MSRIVHSAAAGALVLVCLMGTGPSWGQDIEQGDVAIALERVASGLISPLKVVHAGDDSGRLFIVDQAGFIRIVEDGVLLEEPFLDLSETIVDLSDIFDERGLLGLAFHPDYEINGRFFVRYSLPREGEEDESCNDPKGFIVGCHSAVLAEFSVSEDDANAADPDSEAILFSVDEPEFNHNAGDVAFGPDGFLYFPLGDGGGANDGLDQDPPAHGEGGHGQNIDTPLGAMLRIDVDTGDPYGIPEDNPFVDADGLDEIYAYGLRNPYQFSFDRGGDNELYLGDVGQGLFEEVDIIELGGNYGWAVREGANCFDPFDTGTPPEECETEGLIDPIAEYTHDDGLSVIGGYVYRGDAFPAIEGLYIFGDFSLDFGPTGRLFTIDTAGTLSEIEELQIGAANAPLDLFLKGFGEDEAGELYVCVSNDLAPFGNSGAVYRIVPVPSLIRGDFNGDETVSQVDAILGFEYLFTNGEELCVDALDVDDTGTVDILDGILILDFLFLEGDAPATPYPDCGEDTTVDEVPTGDLGCKAPIDCP